MPNDRYPRILVTGFGPFKDVVENPSSKLAETCGAPYKVLDVAFGAVDEFIAQLDPSGFDALLMIGVAGGRDRMSPEFYGRNFVGKHPDIAGTVRFGEIDPNGPALLASTLWDPRAVADWTMTAPVRASLDAGSYLCNYITYKALERFPKQRVGFLHVPDEEKLSLEVQSQVLSEILDEIAGIHPRLP